MDKLLPVASTACDDEMMVPFHDTLDEFDTTSSELSPPSKVPRMDVACPVVVSTGDGVNSAACSSSNYINVVRNVNNNISIQSPKIESFTAAGVLLGSMAKGMMEGVGPIIHDMLARASKEGGEKL